MDLKRHEFGHGKKAIVFFHGRKSHPLIFAHLLPFLHDYTIIPYHFSDVLVPSLLESKNNMEEIIDDSVNAIKEFDEIHTVGVSMGCCMSVAMANRNENVSKLVLIEGPYRLSLRSWRKQPDYIQECDSFSPPGNPISGRDILVMDRIRPFGLRYSSLSDYLKPDNHVQVDTSIFPKHGLAIVAHLAKVRKITRFLKQTHVQDYSA